MRRAKRRFGHRIGERAAARPHRTVPLADSSVLNVTVALRAPIFVVCTLEITGGTQSTVAVAVTVTLVWPWLRRRRRCRSASPCRRVATCKHANAVDRWKG